MSSLIPPTPVDRSGSPSNASEEVVAWVAWSAGPDAGRRYGLSAGRHIVGRSASAAVRTADSSVELHHVVLVVDGDATIHVEQLAGRHPVRVGTGVIDLGASSLAISDATTRSDRSAAFEPDEIVAPQIVGTDAISAGGVLPALLGTAGSGVLAWLFGQVLFLAFGLIGGAIGVSACIAQRIGAGRSRRAAVQRQRDDLRRFAGELAAQQSGARAAHLASAPSLQRAVADLGSRPALLWAASNSTVTELEASIGDGIGRWVPRVVTGAAPAAAVADLVDGAAALDRVPVTVTFGAGSVLAVVADAAWGAAIARSATLQFAAAAGPAGWQLVVRRVSDSLWDEFRALPHAVDSHGGLRTDMRDVDPERFVVVLLDDPLELALPASELRRMMATHARAAVVVLCRGERDVPAASTSILVVDRQGGGRWIADTDASGLGEPVRPVGASALTVRQLLGSGGHPARQHSPATVAQVCPASSPWGPPSSVPSSATIPDRASSSV